MTPHNLPIQVLEHKEHGLQAIKLLEEPFSGIIYTYGKVDLEEDEENFVLRLKFEYTVLDYANKVLTDEAPFEAYIGKILEQLIHQGVQENSLTYTGGVDENRTKDSDESYS